MPPSPPLAHDGAPIRRAYTQCRYGHMHYREAGWDHDATHPPVVMLHQNPSSGFEFEPLIAQLGLSRRVIALDTPGHGMSDPPPAPPGIAGYAAAFADALDALEINGPVDLYGFHSGTLLAVELALARPAQVRRIALTGIPMYPQDKRAALLHDALTFPAPDAQGEVLLGLLKKLWAYVVEQRAPGIPLDRAIAHFADKSAILDRYTWVYRGVWGYDYARLSALTQPVLVLQPDEPLTPPSREAFALLRAAPGRDPADTLWRDLPDLTREIFDSAPERLSRELCDFFA
ncbi:alpha/beta fold hydrolase [Novosphingobium sp. FSY-8]|uniref:Alpha/beta fold hydrolase n=1 Tax=Novosphingobium ovatum TaxID=1908523 RepID=A0ABW9XBQ4_9SPHN|nr:alpha/beta fold hydrolase [Novosphingobium ovatum]NBC35976.1 alpha/beta fold hydrolase [Novosphingobium ovatum]